MKATEVFTPGRFPNHTFVDAHLRKPRQQLLDTLDAGATLISISGPSKSGKTVFIEQALGRGNLIQVTGAGVSEPDTLWRRVFDAVGTAIPNAVSTIEGTQRTVGAKASIEGGAILVKGKGELSIESAGNSSDTRTSTVIPDLQQMLVREFGGSGFIIFIDDFHYIPKDVQRALAAQIKDALPHGVNFICASVPYRSDDVMRSNPDLRGRVISIDFDYWGDDILKAIATKGFPLLRIQAAPEAISALSREAAGSPQLMQYLCLNTCFELGVREASNAEVRFDYNEELIANICQRTVQSADYASVVTQMKDGPKVRGSDRKLYRTRGGWDGDVYLLLVKALSVNPPQLTFRYNSLIDRISGVCVRSSPSGSSVTSACEQSAKIVNNSARDRVVEWDPENDVFDIRDPYFLFYLRWSGAAGS